MHSVFDENVRLDKVIQLPTGILTAVSDQRNLWQEGARRGR
jgi:hypothetical protein